MMSRPPARVSALRTKAVMALSLLLAIGGAHSRKETSAQRAASLTREAQTLSLEGYGPWVAGNATEAFEKARCPPA